MTASPDPAFREWLLSGLDWTLSQPPEAAGAAFAMMCDELRKARLSWRHALAETASEEFEDLTSTIPPPAGAAPAAQRLVSFITRIERLEGERELAGEAIREIYRDAKAEGFDTKVMRKLIAWRKQDPAKLREEEELFELYRSALEGVAGLALGKPQGVRQGLASVADGAGEEVGDQLERVQGVVAAALASGEATSWEEDFCTEMQGRLEEWGERAFVSAAQWEVIERLEGKGLG